MNDNMIQQDANLPCVGIDIAKDKFDVCFDLKRKTVCFSNEAKGFEKLIKKLPDCGTCLIVVESTGHYHRKLAVALLNAGHLVCVVNPKNVRHYAKALGIEAKTDDIDARVISQFGFQVQPRPLAKTPEKQEQMQELVIRRKQLLNHLTAETNRMDSVRLKSVIRSIEKVTKLFKEQIADIEKQILDLIESDDEFKRKAEVLVSIPGVAKTSAAAIIAELPELGQLNREEISSLVGVAPFNCDSGKYKGQRHIRGGRKRLRSSLYMAAHNARLHNPKFKEFYDQLIARGKLFKVAMVAVMRKLLVIMNTMIKTDTTWNTHLIES